MAEEKFKFSYRRQVVAGIPFNFRGRLIYPGIPTHILAYLSFGEGAHCGGRPVIGTTNGWGLTG
jgi:hypothetical protein